MSTPSEAGQGGSEPALGVIVAERRRLINLAYRLLGSPAEAEDAIQETCTRWYAMSPQRREAVASPGAWLTTVAGRICLDVLGSARVRRERYVGAWIPLTLLERTVNGRPGLVAQHDGVTVTVAAFALDGGRITRIWAVRNSEKLRPWTETPGRPR